MKAKKGLFEVTVWVPELLAAEAEELADAIQALLPPRGLMAADFNPYAENWGFRRRNNG